MEIQLAHGTGAEARTRDAVYRLLEKYDLRRWIFTNTMIVDETATPHSHPVLTIHTKRRERTSACCWRCSCTNNCTGSKSERAADRDRAIEQTRQRYPHRSRRLPPEGAPGTSIRRACTSIVCYLEHCALARLLGAEAGREIIEALSRDHYRWIYRTVLADGDVIRRASAGATISRFRSGKGLRRIAPAGSAAA